MILTHRFQTKIMDMLLINIIKINNSTKIQITQIIIVMLNTSKFKRFLSTRITSMIFKKSNKKELLQAKTLRNLITINSSIWIRLFFLIPNLLIRDWREVLNKLQALISLLKIKDLAILCNTINYNRDNKISCNIINSNNKLKIRISHLSSNMLKFLLYSQVQDKRVNTINLEININRCPSTIPNRKKTFILVLVNNTMEAIISNNLNAQQRQTKIMIVQTPRVLNQWKTKMVVNILVLNKRR